MKFRLQENALLTLYPDNLSEIINSIMEQIQPIITERIDYAISQGMRAGALQKLVDSVDTSSVAQQLSYNSDFVNSVANYGARDFTRVMLEDERFNNRMFRRIADATVGVTNETVERVVAILQEQKNSDGDI